MSQILGQGFLVTQGCPNLPSIRRPPEEYPFECYVTPVGDVEKQSIVCQFPHCPGKLYRVIGFGERKPKYVFWANGDKDFNIGQDIFICEHCGHFVE